MAAPPLPIASARVVARYARNRHRLSQQTRRTRGTSRDLYLAARDAERTTTRETEATQELESSECFRFAPNRVRFRAAQSRTANDIHPALVQGVSPWVMPFECSAAVPSYPPSR